MIARAAVRVLPAAFACVTLAFGSLSTAQAMPNFAKAYGVKCSTCHTLVPALNSYGRYVQRTGYASLKHEVITSVPPFWFGEQINGNSTGGVSEIKPSYTSSFSNIAIHGAGYFAPDWTFHVQQWLVQHDGLDAATLDTIWVTYNNLLHRDGHLFIGKYEAAAPSPYSQFFDISSFQTPEIVVGEHPYLLDANRWGSKLAYVHGALDAEIGWGGSTNGLISFKDFNTTPGTDKTWQWKLASAHADLPLEVGAYGSTGSFIVSTGAADHYFSYAPYVQRDPQPNGIPGFFGVYQWAFDSNPGVDVNGNQLPSAHSQSFIVEPYESMFNRNAVLGFRYAYTNDGLGTLAHYENVDFAFTIPIPHYPYLHGYVEAGLGANSTAPNGGPTWRWLLWWTTSIAQ